MKTLTFSSSAITGFLLALLGIGALTILSSTLGSIFALKLTVAALGGAYSGWLIYRSGESTGRVIVLVTWLVVTATAFSFAGINELVLIQTALIWTVRSLYFHSGLVAVACDAILSVCAIGIGAWALGNSNWFLATWSFFLAQSLAVWIPQPRSRDNKPSIERDFLTAAENARSALQRINS